MTYALAAPNHDHQKGDQTEGRDEANGEPPTTREKAPSGAAVTHALRSKRSRRHGKPPPKLRRLTTDLSGSNDGAGGAPVSGSSGRPTAATVLTH